MNINGFLAFDYIVLNTLHGKIEHFTQIARGGRPPHMGGSDPHFFSRNQNGFTNEACMQNFNGLAQKLWICSPILIFSYLWPVNSICGQTKGQILISIAKMDSLGSIT